MTTKEKDFIRRKKNVDKVSKSIVLIESQIKDAIIKQGLSSDDQEKADLENKINLNTSILSGLVIVWSESMVKWLFYEHGAFEDLQIQLLLSKTDYKQKWTCAISAAFYKAFSGLPYNPSTPIPSKSFINGLTTVSTLDKGKFNVLHDLIQTKLVPAIEVRNKIQHGEWEYCYTKKLGIFSYDTILTPRVLIENILTLRLKRNQFQCLYDIIKDLATFRRVGKFNLDTSSNPFKFYFGKRYYKIMANQKQIDSADYEKYKRDLVESNLRGINWRKKNRFKIFAARIKKLIKQIMK